jgi:hypothetical protein
LKPHDAFKKMPLPTNDDADDDDGDDDDLSDLTIFEDDWRGEQHLAKHHQVGAEVRWERPGVEAD